MNCYFETPFRINSHDCGVNNVLTPTGLLRTLQETANLHVESVGCGYDALVRQNHAFVLSRVAVSVYEPLHAYEKITGRTWPTVQKGVSFNRCSQLLKNGKPVAALTSVWALIDVEKRTLVRASESGISLPEGEAITVEAPLKFRLPQDLPLQEVGEFRVGSSVCDRNFHMNNTRYPDMLCDFLPAMPGKYLTGLSICYASESRLGETLTVYAGREESSGAWFFRTTRHSDGKTGVEARMVFSDL